MRICAGAGFFLPSESAWPHARPLTLADLGPRQRLPHQTGQHGGLEEESRSTIPDSTHGLIVMDWPGVSPESRRETCRGNYEISPRASGRWCWRFGRAGRKALAPDSKSRAKGSFRRRRASQAGARAVRKPRPMHSPPDSESATNWDRLLRAWRGRLSFGLSPTGLSLVYLDWLLHLGVSPGKQIDLVRKSLRKGLRFMRMPPAR